MSYLTSELYYRTIDGVQTMQETGQHKNVAVENMKSRISSSSQQFVRGNVCNLFTRRDSNTGKRGYVLRVLPVALYWDASKEFMWLIKAVRLASSLVQMKKMSSI